MLSPTGSSSADEWAAKVKRYVQFESTKLKGNPKRTNDPGVQIAAEGSQLLAALDGRDYVVALDERGQQYTSHDFAHLIAKAGTHCTQATAHQRTHLRASIVLTLPTDSTLFRCSQLASQLQASCCCLATPSPCLAQNQPRCIGVTASSELQRFCQYTAGIAACVLIALHTVR